MAGITQDVRANFKSILGEVDASARFASLAAPGYFNDMDCLEVGMKHDTGSGMTPVEERTHMALWSMFASPLMAGNDLRQMSKPGLQNLGVETVFRPRKSTSSFFLLKWGVQMQYLFNQKPNTPF